VGLVVGEDSIGFRVCYRLYQAVVQLLLVWVVLWELLMRAILHLPQTVVTVDFQHLIPIRVELQEVRAENESSRTPKQYPHKQMVEMVDLETEPLPVEEE
jgi:hypothetical protein